VDHSLLAGGAAIDDCGGDVDEGAGEVDECADEGEEHTGGLDGVEPLLHRGLPVAIAGPGAPVGRVRVQRWSVFSGYAIGTGPGTGPRCNRSHR